MTAKKTKTEVPPGPGNVPTRPAPQQMPTLTGTTQEIFKIDQTLDAISEKLDKLVAVQQDAADAIDRLADIMDRIADKYAA